MIEMFTTFFTDPVLRAPTIGCMLMCLAASLVGVIAFLRKQSLLGESLSHAAYPGVIIAIVAYATLISQEFNEEWVSFFVILGASLSSLAGLWCINFLKNRIGVRVDAAMCFVLSVFFGFGITLASRVQFTHSALYAQIQAYLYGQAATMKDIHIAIYGGLSLLVIICVMALYKELQVINFDRDFAITIGIKTGLVEIIFFFLIVFAVIVGIRSVGVVLMSAMLIAPAASARQYTNKLSMMFVLSGAFGLLSGFMGIFCSVKFSHYLSVRYPDMHVTLPTGPMIVIVASCICFLSLLLAPERGIILRYRRMLAFRFQCMQENLLKTLWRYGKEEGLTIKGLSRIQRSYHFVLFVHIMRLVMQGWVRKKRGHYILTHDGQQKAAHIVRLHRLWEVYLANYLGFGVERVHKSAEEMEHIITPELEKTLTEILHDPKYDPHLQPIPSKEATIS